MRFDGHGSSPLAGEAGWGGSVSWLVFPVSPSPDLSLDGRRGLWSLLRGFAVVNSVLDFGEYTLEVIPNFRIPKSQHTKPLTSKKLISYFVTRIIQVLTTIGFNNQFMFKANKVENVSVNRFLSAKLGIKMLATQMSPENSFFWGHLAPQVSGKICQSHKCHYEVARGI